MGREGRVAWSLKGGGGGEEWAVDVSKRTGVRGGQGKEGCTTVNTPSGDRDALIWSLKGEGGKGGKNLSQGKAGGKGGEEQRGVQRSTRRQGARMP